MARTASNRALLGIIVFLAACSTGESADNPPGSTVDRPAAPKAAAPATYTLSGGTLVDAALTDTITSRRALAGDAFSAVVMTNVMSPNGAVAIPAGSVVHGTIVEVSPAPNDGAVGTLTLAVSNMTVRGTTYALDASIDSLRTVQEGRGIERADAIRVAGGAAAGAVIGQVIGGNTKGTVIGTVIGAATGAAVSALVKDMDIVLPEGSHLMLTLRQPLTVAAK